MDKINENKKTNETAMVKTYVYDQRVIGEVYKLLNQITVTGVEQASILSAIGQYLRSPIKEDETKVNE